MSTATPSAPAWAIVELFGHSRIAGALREHYFAGATFLRVHVPAIEVEDRRFDRESGRWVVESTTIAAHSTDLGVGAVYAIHHCDEAQARAAAAALRHVPMSPHALAAALQSLPQAERLRVAAQLADIGPTAQEAAP